MSILTLITVGAASLWMHDSQTSEIQMAHKTKTENDLQKSEIFNHQSLNKNISAQSPKVKYHVGSLGAGYTGAANWQTIAANSLELPNSGSGQQSGIYPYAMQGIGSEAQQLIPSQKGGMYSKLKAADIQPWEKYSVFRAPWVGIHFAMQNPISEELQDSGRQNAGFSIQIMSSNLLKNSDLGAYLGGEFGMQFLGRGPKSQVVINTVHQDSGYTRLNSMSMDFFMRGHLEYGRFFIKPYLNFMAGPRIYTTGQHTESYMKLTDYENSDQSNVHTSVSLMAGAAIGARVRIAPLVSLDARWEYMRGTAVNLVNLDKSEFNGLSYTLSKFNATPEYSQFKVGILFELSDNSPKEDKRYTQYNQSEMSSLSNTTTNIYYDSTIKQFVECKCTCTKTPLGSENNSSTDNAGKRSSSGTEVQFRTERDLDPSNDRKDSRVTPDISVGGSGSSGSGKKAFPGIKPSSSPVKIKH